ncbi:Uncharacterised protein [Pseudomonas aeruginosa]|nr:Uncharacterised protein [Pseudomonas aeruginosa]
MNTPSRMSQPQKSCGETHAACRERPPMITPKKPLPASPMKIRAGGKFQKRNPVTAAASSAANQTPWDASSEPTPLTTTSRAAPTHTHSLNAGNPIDTVHEIVEIEHPYQIERRSYVSNPPQIDHKAEKGQCRQTSKPVQQPASTGEMAEQTPTGSDMAMIVEEAQQCDPNTRPQDTSGQIRFHRAQYRRKQHCQQEGEHDSDTAPPRRRHLVRTSSIGYIDQAAGNRVTAQAGGQQQGKSGNRRQQQP